MVHATHLMEKVTMKQADIKETYRNKTHQIHPTTQPTREPGAATVLVFLSSSTEKSWKQITQKSSGGFWSNRELFL